VISRELVKKLKKIEIYTSRLANDQLAGSYHSVFKGRGMAFSEVRQYQPGRRPLHRLECQRAHE
jgi:uncharacterized protein (DUF58 family)